MKLYIVPVVIQTAITEISTRTMRITSNRVILHIGFWMVYFFVISFNELYLTSDFTLHSDDRGLEKAFLSEFNLVIIKIAITYYALYSFIPRWLKMTGRSMLALEGIIVLSAGVIAYRTMVHFVNWPLVFGEKPENLSGLSLVARIFYTLMDIAQIVGIAVAIKLFRLRIAAMQHEKELVKEKMKSEILHLKSQINPHFLFNMLNSIYSLSKIQAPHTPDVVHRLSVMLRYMLYESEKPLASIEEEIRIVDDYTELQQLRFENRVDLQKYISVDDPQTPITPLLILPLIENAYKHGVGSSSNHSLIAIDVRLEKRMLVVKVKNTIATESFKLKDYDGIGLANIKRQLYLLYRDYNLDISHDTQYFCVDLKINIDSYVGVELFDSRR